MSSQVLSRFLSNECDEQVRSLLIHEATTSNSGQQYFTFNMFNVLLDFDARIATIEDEFDPDVEEVVALPVFRAALEQRQP